MRRLVVELTSRCNLNCRHCLLPRPAAAYDLPAELLERVLPDARRLGFETIGFTGGEAALHPEFDRAVGLAAREGLRFGVTSNGSAVSHLTETLDRRRASLEVVSFSLDGATESVHDWLRGSGAFRRMLRAVSVCVVRRLPFTFNSVLTRHNCGHLEVTVALAGKLGSRGLRFGHLIPTAQTAACGLDLSPVEQERVDARIRLLGTQSDIPVALAPGGYTLDLFPCRSLRSDEATVDCRGNIKWCCQLPPAAGAGAAEAAVGNLAATPLAELLLRLERRRVDFRREKVERLRAGMLRDSDFFPCRYCAENYGRACTPGKEPSHVGSRYDSQAPS